MRLEPIKHVFVNAHGNGFLTDIGGRKRKCLGKYPRNIVKPQGCTHNSSENQLSYRKLIDSVNASNWSSEILQLDLPFGLAHKVQLKELNKVPRSARKRAFNLQETACLFSEDLVKEADSQSLKKLSSNILIKRLNNIQINDQLVEDRLIIIRKFLQLLKKIDSDFSSVSRIIASKDRLRLNAFFTHVVRREPIRGKLSLDMLLLAKSLQRSGHVYLGDVTQLRSEEVLMHAIALNRLKEPERMLFQVQKILGKNGLALGMPLLNWHRPIETTFECALAKRDARNEQAAKRKLTKTESTKYLKLIVTPNRQ